LSDSSTSPSSATTEEGLVRGIRRWDLVLLVLNSVIGAGIFGLPARTYALVGSWSLLAYAACAGIIVLLGLSFAEVASRFRTTGGPFVYVREAYGPTAGFLAGWLLWLTRLTAFAALCNLWLDYLDYFWPGANAGATRGILITAIVTVYTLVNIRGVRTSTILNDTMTLAKLVPLFILVAVGAFFIDPGNFSFAEAPGASSFTSAVLLLVFAFTGFEAVMVTTGESQEPRRHLPFALMTGIGIIVLLYVLIQFVSIGNLPGLGDSTRPLADVAESFLGRPGAVLISLGALISVGGTLNVIMLTAPRLPFAMAESGEIPRVFSATHERWHTPYVSIVFSAVVILVLTLQGSFISSLTISTVIRLVVYAATCAALPVLRRKLGVEGAFLAPAGVIVAVASTTFCVSLILTSGWGEISKTLLAGGLGIVLYFGYRKLGMYRGR
jgi:amino acid transporter